MPLFWIEEKYSIKDSLKKIIKRHKNTLVTAGLVTSMIISLKTTRNLLGKIISIIKK